MLASNWPAFASSGAGSGVETATGMHQPYSKDFNNRLHHIRHDEPFKRQILCANEFSRCVTWPVDPNTGIDN